ncbi:hypothetical protein BDB00DRAFT_6566 [Zychaea mexicana]|uniref:uncharacterized protein n=1 Tax=Zychaea mexicana TaxID=64656 RepID=UPI0022FDB338|nr:uncharacterized protein BDB00DRAFT_6566 [Zychaea mexicana]KAI9499551.1 hypothetical protein BDB00DRAFT_6566 [Zychaea mexicana]
MPLPLNINGDPTTSYQLVLTVKPTNEHTPYPSFVTYRLFPVLFTFFFSLSYMTISRLSIFILLAAAIAAVSLANRDNNEDNSTGPVRDVVTAVTAAAEEAVITNTAAETATNTTATTDGSLAMIVLLSAGSLAFSFFRLVGLSIYNVITTLLLPVYYVLAFFWRNMVSRPFELLLNIGHALYPVAMYCLAAICCGTLIGGCAGFAAEAIASFTISTTWGRSRTTAGSSQRQQHKLAMPHHQHYHPNQYLYDTEDDDISTRASFTSEISSQWDPSFFGEQQQSPLPRQQHLGIAKDKERVDSWRQSLDSRESASSPRVPSSSTMMYMSPLDNSTAQQRPRPSPLRHSMDHHPQEPMDDWAWDDDDDDDDKAGDNSNGISDSDGIDEFPRLRRRSVVR